MATLQQRLTAFADAVQAKINPIWTGINGTTTAGVAGLNTTATNLVAAVNEVKGVADAAAGGGISIDDVTASTSTAYSSSRIEARITAESTSVANAAIVTALEGEDLSDLAAAVAANAANDLNLATAASVTTLSNTVANKANSSDVFTQTELGNIDFDLAAYFTAL